MKNIFKIYFRDLKKIFTNSMAIILAVGIAVLPSLYAWFNIFANWDPYGKTGNMMVAVVNEDEGAYYRDIKIDVGEQIVTNLKGNDAINWQFVSKDEALNGIKSGKYYAGIEIPQGFSKSLTSIVTSNFEQPQITYYANEKKNAIATKITDKVVETVQTEVNESFVTTVIGMINKILGTIVEESQATGTNVFEDLQAEIKNATDSVNAIQGTLDGFQNVMKLLGDLEPTLNDSDLASLLNNTSLVINDSQDLISVVQSSAGTILGALGTALDGGASTLRNVSTTVTSVGSSVTSTGITAIKNASGDVTNLKNDIDKISETLSQINSSLNTPISEIDSVVQRLNSVSSTLTGIITSLDSIANGSFEGDVEKLAGALNDAANTLDGIKNDYNNNVEPKITGAVTNLTKTLGDISNVLSALDKDLPGIKNVLSALKDSVSAGDSMVGSVSILLNNATGLLSDLSDKLVKLSNSDIINAIVNITGNNTDELGEFLACPVEVKTDKIYGIENYGSAMAPFYSTLAIWVGAMFLAAVMKPNVKKKKQIGRVKPYQEFFGRGLTYVSFSIIQTVIICLGDLLFFKIQCYHPVKFMLAGVISAIVYSFFIYALTYTLGDIGKALGVIMLVVQIGGSGGTFPIDVTPDLFVALNPFLPFTFTIEAMRECICGLYQNIYWIWLLKLLAYFVAALVMGLMVKPIVKNPLKFFTKKVEDTDLF